MSGSPILCEEHVLFVQVALLAPIHTTKSTSQLLCFHETLVKKLLLAGHNVRFLQRFQYPIAPNFRISFQRLNL